MLTPYRRLPSASGFALLEVLIAVVILAFGLLGLAGLQTRAQTAEIESYQRTQALILLSDMVDRLNTNRKNAASYAMTSSQYVGDSATLTLTCNGSVTTQAQLDLCQWDQALKGASEVRGTSTFVGAMVGARGCVQQLDAANRIYMVSVVWQGVAQTAAPVSGVTCASGTYGTDESYRRAVTATLQIGNLS